MASLHLLNWNLRRCPALGRHRFCRSYIGATGPPRLADLLEVLLVNHKPHGAAICGNWLGRLMYRIKHHNSTATPKTNSHKNIHAHYDLGNAFSSCGWTAR
jgi:cyclopropane-fatty-acyl-phospholipid synthase